MALANRLDQIAVEIRTTWGRVQRDTALTKRLLEEARTLCRARGESFDRWCLSGKIGIGKTQIYNLLGGHSSSHHMDVRSVHPVNAVSDNRKFYGGTPTKWAAKSVPQAMNTVDAEEDADDVGFNLLGNMGGAGCNVTHTHTEWYSPVSLFEGLGNPMFDLDPASPGADVVPWIPAKRHLTKADDGLAADWGDAFLYLNLPFGVRNGMLEFIDKFINHRNGVIVFPCYANNRWWHDVISAVDAVLFPKKRIKFINGRPGEGSDSFGIVGVCLAAIGERGVDALRTGAHNRLGTLMVPWRN